jgi:hypothetical protein
VPEDRPAQLAGLIRDFVSGVEQLVPPPAPTRDRVIT